MTCLTIFYPKFVISDDTATSLIVERISVTSNACMAVWHKGLIPSKCQVDRVQETCWCPVQTSWQSSVLHIWELKSLVTCPEIWHRISKGTNKSLGFKGIQIQNDRSSTNQLLPLHSHCITHHYTLTPYLLY